MAGVPAPAAPSGCSASRRLPCKYRSHGYANDPHGAAGQGTLTSGRHARERETSADDPALCQLEFRTLFRSRMPRPLTAPPTRGRASCPAGCTGGPDHAGPCRWDPTQRPPGPRAVPCRPPSRNAGTWPALRQTVSATPRYGSRRTLRFPPTRGHPGTGSPSRRPPSAGCAGRRPAFQAVPAVVLWRVEPFRRR